MAKIKVLVVDDSALVRQVLSKIISSDSKLEIIGTASDPYNAVNIIKEQEPDVITLDIEMPKMDGLTFLKKVMSQHPIPIVVISSLSQKGTETAIKALEFGAVDVIAKPQLNIKSFFEDESAKIVRAVVAASKATVHRRKAVVIKNIDVEPKYSADVVISKSFSRSMVKTTEKVVVVGASTGGTEAIRQFLLELPYDCPGIVIVQHMPEFFTTSFAKRLNEICSITVKEAEDGDTVIRGRALIAPGNYHLALQRSGARYFVKKMSGEMVNRHRPSVDVLFRSTAQFAGKNAVGIIMTGMGDDGAQGLKEMRDAGALTIAQDEKSCVVFGMPKEAIARNAATKIVPLKDIHRYVMHL